MKLNYRKYNKITYLDDNNIIRCYKYTKEENKMIKKVAILANGGDVPGLNPVIRAIKKTAKWNRMLWIY